MKKILLLLSLVCFSTTAMAHDNVKHRKHKTQKLKGEERYEKEIAREKISPNAETVNTGTPAKKSKSSGKLVSKDYKNNVDPEKKSSLDR